MNAFENTTDVVLDQIAADFNFDVELRKNGFEIPDSEGNLTGSNFQADGNFRCVRTDTQAAVGQGIVSSGYHPHTSDDVVTLCQEAIHAFGEGVARAETDFDYRSGHRVIISPAADFMRTVTGSDTVFPRLIIRAGYGGSSSFNCTLGLYRSLCTNLEMFETHKSMQFRHRHTRGLRDKLDVLKNTFRGLRGSWDKIEKAIDLANSRHVPIRHSLEQVYGKPATEDQIEKYEKRLDAVISRLHKERMKGGYGLTEEGMATAWEIYQSVQGYQMWDCTRSTYIHEGMRYRRQDLDRAVAASNNSAVKKAEKLFFVAA